MLLIIAGGVAGFLYFNLRYLRQRRARCFLGDNGSMLLGFVFAWLLSDLSQMTDGSPRAITPITTLWLFAVPLIDTLCVMLRRMWLGRSPFHADRHHLHHLFLRAGFRVQDTVLVLAFLQALLSDGCRSVPVNIIGVPPEHLGWIWSRPEVVRWAPELLDLGPGQGLWERGTDGFPLMMTRRLL